jgi:hypothetical protein
MQTQSNALTKENLGFIAKSELRKKYGVCKSTFCTYLDLAGIQKSRRKYYTPAEVKKIYEKLGEP